MWGVEDPTDYLNLDPIVFLHYFPLCTHLSNLIRARFQSLWGWNGHTLTVSYAGRLTISGFYWPGFFLPPPISSDFCRVPLYIPAA
jgi:hypothetical protein